MPSPPPERSPRTRSRLGVLLCWVAFAAALVMASPSLTQGMWMARLALRETSLLTTALALVGFAFAGRGAGWTARGARKLALLAALVGVVPFLAQWLTLRRNGLPFSIVEYVIGPGRSGPLPQLNVVFEPRNPPLRADVWPAPGAGPHPFVLAVHGGSWRAGEKGQGTHTFRSLAAAGYTVVDVEYGLAPAHPFPEGIADVKCLLGRVRERAAELHIDPRQGVLLGRSAGGQIALVAAYSAGDPRLAPSCDVPDRPVQGVVGIYSPVDLIYGHANPMQPDVIRTTESLELYLGGPPTRQLEAYRLASPLAWLDHAVPPTLLLHGSGDAIVESLHSVLLASQLEARGQRVELIVVPFGEHGFDMRPGSVGEQLARGATLRFLSGLRSLSRSVARSRGDQPAKAWIFPTSSSRSPSVSRRSVAG